jgi:Flp pilus assembly pilin Flp
MLSTYVMMDDFVRQMRDKCFDIFDREDGQGMTEYVLILALVAVALFGVIQFTGLGSSLASAVTRVVSSVDAQAS